MAEPMTDWLTLREAASATGYHPKAIYRVVTRLGLPTMERAGMRWIKREDVARIPPPKAGRPKRQP